MQTDEAAANAKHSLHANDLEEAPPVPEYYQQNYEKPMHAVNNMENSLDEQPKSVEDHLEPLPKPLPLIKDDKGSGYEKRGPTYRMFQL